MSISLAVRRDLRSGHFPSIDVPTPAHRLEQRPERPLPALRLLPEQNVVGEDEPAPLAEPATASIIRFPERW